MYSTVYVQLSIATDWQSKNILFDSCKQKTRYTVQLNAHALASHGRSRCLLVLCAAHGSLFFILNSESQIQEYVYKNVLYS